MDQDEFLNGEEDREKDEKEEIIKEIVNALREENYEVLLGVEKLAKDALKNDITIREGLIEYSQKGFTILMPATCRGNYNEQIISPTSNPNSVETLPTTTHDLSANDPSEPGNQEQTISQPRKRHDKDDGMHPHQKKIKEDKDNQVNTRQTPMIESNEREIQQDSRAPDGDAVPTVEQLNRSEEQERIIAEAELGMAQVLGELLDMENEMKRMEAIAAKIQASEEGANESSQELPDDNDDEDATLPTPPSTVDAGPDADIQNDSVSSQTQPTEDENIPCTSATSVPPSVPEPPPPQNEASFPKLKFRIRKTPGVERRMQKELEKMKSKLRNGQTFIPFLMNSTLDFNVLVDTIHSRVDRVTHYYCLVDLALIVGKPRPVVYAVIMLLDQATRIHDLSNFLAVQKSKSSHSMSRKKKSITSSSKSARPSNRKNSKKSLIWDLRYLLMLALADEILRN